MSATGPRAELRALLAPIPRERLRAALHAAVDAFVDDLAPRPRRLGAARARRPAAGEGDADDPPAPPEMAELEAELRRKGVIL